MDEVLDYLSSTEIDIPITEENGAIPSTSTNQNQDHLDNEILFTEEDNEFTSDEEGSGGGSDDEDTVSGEDNDSDDDDDSIKVYFKKIAPMGCIDLKSFLGELSRSNDIPAKAATDLFNKLDVKSKGIIDMNAFVNGMENILLSDWKTRAEFVFNLFDTDGEGKITKSKLALVVTRSLSNNALALPPSTIDKFAKIIFAQFIDHKNLEIEESGHGNSTEEGYSIGIAEREDEITLSVFIKTLQSNPELRAAFRFHPLDFLQVKKLGRKCSFRQKKDKHSKIGIGSIRRPSLKPIYKSFGDVHVNNFRGFSTSSIIWFCLYIAGSIICGAYRVNQHKLLHSTVQLQVAKFGGINITYNAMLLCLSMCRHLIFFLGQNTYAAKFLPLDINVPMHKIFGTMTCVWVIVHVGGCMANWMINNGQEVTVLKTFTTSVHINGWVGNSTGPTGVALLLVLGAIVGTFISVKYMPVLGQHLVKASIISQDSAKKYFNVPYEVFAYSHWVLSLIYLGMLMLHAPQVWPILSGPLTFLVFEFIIRYYKSSETTQVVVAQALPGNVTMIEVARPNNFAKWKTGSWCFVKIPAVSGYEWHPFTIASSPEKLNGRITLNIRSLGKDTWTGKVRTLVEKCTVSKKKEKGDKGFIDLELNDNSKVIQACQNIKVQLDGPYFAPTQRVFNYHHSILVCGGIGVTPSISIFETILLRCRKAALGSHRAYFGKLRRLDFFWLINDMDCTEWFSKLLNKISARIEAHPHSDLAKTLHIHICLTNVDRTKDDSLLSLAVESMIGSDVGGKRRNSFTTLELGFDNDDNNIEPSKPKKEDPKKRGSRNSKDFRVFPGRPQWGQMLHNLKKCSPAPDDMAVFFCGAPGLGKDLAANCYEKGIAFRQEVFN